ncbi:MAG: hypothetical protein GXP43_01390 [bacterium]|nr:hypothetical protein [bacterium]
MNKEVIGAILIGLLLGLGGFLGVRQMGRVMNWWQQRPNEKVDQIIQASPTEIEKVVKVTGSKKKEFKLEVVKPEPFFLIKTKKVDIKLRVASGSGVLMRVNNKIFYKVADGGSMTVPVKLESGANLIEASVVKDNLAIGKTVRINGVVSSQKYPKTAKGLSGVLTEVKEDEVRIKTTAGGEMALRVKPLTKLYAFDDNGRRVSLTKLEDKFVGRPAIAIFEPVEERNQLIKLLIVKDLEWGKVSYFRGNVSKVDDDKGVYQVVNLENQVKDVALAGVDIYEAAGGMIKRDQVGLEDDLLLAYLAEKLKLVVVLPQTNLLER